MTEPQHDDIYYHAALYDLAFSYRDYVAEVDLAKKSDLVISGPGG